MWLGMDVDLGGGSLRTAGNAWEALLAHRLRLSVGVCSMRHLQQFLGRAQWICRPRFGHGLHLSGVWPMCYGDPPTPPAVSLCQVAALYVCGVCLGVAGLVASMPTSGRGLFVGSRCSCMWMLPSLRRCTVWGFFCLNSV